MNTDAKIVQAFGFTDKMRIALHNRLVPDKIIVVLSMAPYSRLLAVWPFAMGYQVWHPL
jgi:hypothetical protein